MFLRVIVLPNNLFSTEGKQCLDVSTAIPSLCRSAE